MALHLIKLCVGAASIEELAAWQRQRLTETRKAGEARVGHATFQAPKRQAELLDGGSLYWVIKGVVQARQRLLGFEDGTKSDGTPACRIMLDPEIVPVRPVPRRAFQGWRYFAAEDAPPDLGSGESGLANLPAKLRRDLAELCLI